VLKIPLKTLTKLKDHRGFTLIELMLCIMILSCLMTIALFLFQDFRNRSSDLQALAEGKNLLTVASDVFLANEDVLFTTGDPHAGAVGTLKSDGITPRNAVFTFSSKIRARLAGQSTPQLGGRFLTFDIWSLDGSDAGTISGKSEYRFVIDEDNSIITTPTS
jgi:prepilin-type N-terminal cleavage/methylation domain-containing protein